MCEFLTLLGRVGADRFGPSGNVWTIAQIVSYILWAIAFYKIAEKTGTPNGWMAFIPILNVILFFQCAGKSGWWFLLLFIPIVNIVILLVAFSSLFQRCGRPGWWWVLMLIPLVNIIVLLMVAFESRPQAATY
jgi:magnesium-transporting ATPase (P-type)